MIESLSWDSDFFNLKIGSIGVNELDSESMNVLEHNKSSYDLVYVFVSQQSPFLGELVNRKLGLDLVDVKVTYSKAVEQHLLNVDTVRIFNSRKVTKKLYELAIQSGEFSRFKLDPRFKSDDFLNLYRKWVENAAEEETNSLIVVNETKEGINGMITAKLNSVDAKVGLLAVDQKFRGQGIAYNLICYLENVLSSRDIKLLSIPTQKTNNKACRFYERLGMKVDKEETVLHYWT